tara:strand:- start:1042 stop:1332 length:291 start_codon:yes stop_codon:yes gene_type:complete
MWYFYVVKCSDSSFYAGVTTELTRRVKEHNSDDRRGAKYTRSRRPVELIYSEEYPSRSAAQKEEYRFKQLDRKTKERVISEKLLTTLSRSRGFNYE